LVIVKFVYFLKIKVEVCLKFPSNFNQTAIKLLGKLQPNCEGQNTTKNEQKSPNFKANFEQTSTCALKFDQTSRQTASSLVETSSKLQPFLALYLNFQIVVIKVTSNMIQI